MTYDAQLVSDWGFIFATAAMFNYSDITIVNMINYEPTAKLTTSSENVNQLANNEINESVFWEGVEISEHRVNLQTRDVCIWQGDFLKESFRPYNVLHADNLCLEDYVAEELELKIAREFSGLYITYRTPASIEFLKVARHLMTVLTETTWTLHPIQYWILN
jgi:hypothetical protein